MEAMISNYQNFLNESESDERIYLSTKFSEYFKTPYMNDGEDFVIDSDALRDVNDEWDTAHKDLWQKYRGKTLILRGKGHGWWKIVNAT